MYVHGRSKHLLGTHQKGEDEYALRPSSSSPLPLPPFPRLSLPSFCHVDGRFSPAARI